MSRPNCVSGYGTPPRLWGKLSAWISRAESSRYTPTPVGKTMKIGKRVARLAVHPHACGENGALSSSSSATTGTPPRLWGKRCAQNPLSTIPRYTPTPVGKTHSQVSLQQRPHGTPPRLWGKRPSLCRACIPRRYTPTPVGKTPQSNHTSRTGPVHPHACGENRARHSQDRKSKRYTPTPVGKTLGPNISVSHVFGTPPRLWGKRLQH